MLIALNLSMPHCPPLAPLWILWWENLLAAGQCMLPAAGTGQGQGEAGIVAQRWLEGRRCCGQCKRRSEGSTSAAITHAAPAPSNPARVFGFCAPSTLEGRACKPRSSSTAATATDCSAGVLLFFDVL